MRRDAIGLFWEDRPAERRTAKDAVRVMPPIPNTGWSAPTDYPNLSAAKMISIDVEANDPGLKEKGPGYPRGDAYVCGISIGTDDGFRAYYPVAHQLGGNLDQEMTFRWLKRELGRANQPKIGAKLIYDLEALAFHGVDVKGPLIDVQVAEPLIDENQYTFNLEKLGQKYLGEGKVQEELYRWAAQAYGGEAKRSAQAANIWRSPVSLVGPYAESDVDLPLRVYEKQKLILEEQGLTDLFRMECEIIPILLGMRRRGVRVDVQRAEQINEVLKRKQKEDLAKLKHLTGVEINVNAADSIARAFDKVGISYPLTEKTKKPSFTKAWLEACDHPIAQAITDIRKWDKFRGTFIEGYILNCQQGGRVYGQFHQLKTDDGGAVSGRFSSSDPNLENIPSRDETKIEILDRFGNPINMKMGDAVRSLFLPEEGEDWYSDDYSQVEYRIICHFGEGPSAEKARRLYRSDPKTDFHDLVVEWTGLARKRAKGINFGKSYGMGLATAAANLGCSIEEAKFFMDRYDEELPFVKELLETVGNEAMKRGFIRTILMRRARFDLWEAKSWDDKSPALPYEQAVQKWGRYGCRRAGQHKALNRLIQGSAADMFKKALTDIRKAGVMDVLGAPLNLVHDEVCWSVPRTREAKEAHEVALQCMKHAVKLKVPILVDSECGPNWGEVK